jgi:hypothetical protein
VLLLLLICVSPVIASKFVPVIETLVPPADEPLFGVTDETVGWPAANAVLKSSILVSRGTGKRRTAAMAIVADLVKIVFFQLRRISKDDDTPAFFHQNIFC